MQLIARNSLSLASLHSLMFCNVLPPLDSTRSWCEDWSVCGIECHKLKISIYLKNTREKEENKWNKIKKKALKSKTESESWLVYECDDRRINNFSTWTCFFLTLTWLPYYMDVVVAYVWFCCAVDDWTQLINQISCNLPYKDSPASTFLDFLLIFTHDISLHVEGKIHQTEDKQMPCVMCMRLVPMLTMCAHCIRL